MIPNCGGKHRGNNRMHIDLQIKAFGMKIKWTRLTTAEERDGLAMHWCTSTLVHVLV